jgi:hypothetical protein
MRRYAESVPSDERRAYTEIINDLSNAVSALSPRSAETNERTPKGHRASAERRAYTEIINSETNDNGISM